MRPHYGFLNYLVTVGATEGMEGQRRGGERVTISLRPAVLEEAGAEGVGVEAPLVQPETAPLGAETSLATLCATGWMTWVKVSLVLAASKPDNHFPN